jgi:hypothetical protein
MDEHPYLDLLRADAAFSRAVRALTAGGPSDGTVSEACARYATLLSEEALRGYMIESQTDVVKNCYAREFQMAKKPTKRISRKDDEHAAGR